MNNKNHRLSINKEHISDNKGHSFMKSSDHSCQTENDNQRVKFDN